MSKDNNKPVGDPTAHDRNGGRSMHRTLKRPASRGPRTPRLQDNKIRSIVLAAVAIAAVTLLGLGVVYHALGTPKTEAPSLIAAALDVQRVPLPTGPGYAFTLGLMTTDENGTSLTFRSGQTYEFVVRQDGREIWRWSAGRAFHQAIMERPLAAGELMVFVHIWDGKDALGHPVSGDVTVEGLITATPAIEAPPIRMFVDGSVKGEK